jgi:hypothetical protein
MLDGYRPRSAVCERVTGPDERGCADDRGCAEDRDCPADCDCLVLSWDWLWDLVTGPLDAGTGLLFPG